MELDSTKAGGSGWGVSNKGKEPRTRTLPTDISTNKPSGRTTGCRLRGVPQLGHIGVAPRGGCRTVAGPQQQVSQRKRGMHSTRTRQDRPSIQSPDHLGDLIGTDRAFQTGFDIRHLTTRLPLSLPNRSFTTHHLPHPPRRGCIGFSTNNHEITGSQVSIGGVPAGHRCRTVIHSHREPPQVVHLYS